MDEPLETVIQVVASSSYCQKNESKRDAASKIEWGSGRIFELKHKRNRRETQRIVELEDDFIRDLLVQEKCFERFSERYDRLYRDCKLRKLS